MRSGVSFTEDGFRYMIPAVDVTEVYNEGFEDGRVQGYEEGKKESGAEECAAKHLVVDVEGDGSGSLTFHCPFVPDTITITGYGAVYASTEPVYNDTAKKDAFPGSVALYSYDGTCKETYGGSVGIYAASGSQKTVKFSGSASATHSSRYSRTDDGQVTISNLIVAVNEATKISGTSTYTLQYVYYSGVFAEGCIYHVVCEKHT